MKFYQEESSLPVGIAPIFFDRRGVVNFSDVAVPRRMQGLYSVVFGFYSQGMRFRKLWLLRFLSSLHPYQCREGKKSHRCSCAEFMRSLVNTSTWQVLSTRSHQRLLPCISYRYTYVSTHGTKFQLHCTLKGKFRRAGHPSTKNPK